MSDYAAAWKTPRQICECRTADLIGGFMPDTDRAVDEARAAAIVDAIFRVLAEPDRDMTAAGANELALALPPDAGKAYVRNLARAVWLTMIAEAR